MDAWSPNQYDRFKLERRRPFDDLLALVVPHPDMRVIDLGSGTGELTRALHERLGSRETTGLERSAAMRARSDAFAAAGLHFVAGDISEFRADSEYDLVFSNAALHWVGDHPALFARLAQALNPRGQLAVQMPANFDHPSHTVAAGVAREEPFRQALDGFAVDQPVDSVERYAELLYGLGLPTQHVRLQVYGHPLSTGAEVIEWVRGTLLTAYQERLSQALFERFVERYRSELAKHVALDAPYFFAFKRILLWARR
jgi:trans-aconitate 2-methyltransferase